MEREPQEPVNHSLTTFYSRLLHITKRDIFKEGEWSLLKTQPAWDGDKTYSHILAWMWKKTEERVVVAVNYSVRLSTCRIQLNTPLEAEPVEFTDLLDGQPYIRSAQEVSDTGLYVQLERFQSHIFSFNRSW